VAAVAVTVIVTVTLTAVAGGGRGVGEARVRDQIGREKENGRKSGMEMKATQALLV
jgi:hypothetical protein